MTRTRDKEKPKALTGQLGGYQSEPIQITSPHMDVRLLIQAIHGFQDSVPLNSAQFSFPAELCEQLKITLFNCVKGWGQDAPQPHLTNYTPEYCACTSLACMFGSLLSAAISALADATTMSVSAP